MLLYDDLKTWRNLLPLTFTRSVAECRVRIHTIQEKWEKYAKIRKNSLIISTNAMDR